MNENAAKLVATLRSGEFEQASGALRRDGDRYCCLGVACELYRRETGEGSWSKTAARWEFKGVEEGVSTTYLPRIVRDWLGFYSTRGLYGHGEALASDNDHGDTFEEIADTIEREPEALFSETTKEAA